MYCDAAAFAVHDPTLQAGAFWYPFGPVVGPQTAIGISHETATCNTADLFSLTPGKAYTYGKAGIVWSPGGVFGDSLHPSSWGSQCKQAFPPNSQAQIDTWWRNLSARIAMHEILHHFGFAHFTEFPVLVAQMPCSGGNNFPAQPLIVSKAMSTLDVRNVTTPPLPAGVGADVNTIAGGIELACGNAQGFNGN